MTTSPTRRTVVRGAAWSAPLIAVGVAAPAFATSPKPPPTIVGAVQAGKCPGQSTEFEFGFVIPVQLSAEVTSFSVTTLIYNGNSVPTCTAPADPVPSDLWSVSFDEDSSANGTGTVSGTYSGTYNDGNNPNAPFSGTFNGDYDGTRPIPNKVRQAVCTAAGNCS